MARADVGIAGAVIHQSSPLDELFALLGEGGKPLRIEFRFHDEHHRARPRKAKDVFGIYFVGRSRRAARCQGVFGIRNPMVNIEYQVALGSC